MYRFLKIIINKSTLSGILFFMSISATAIAQQQELPAASVDNYDIVRYVLSGMCLLLLMVIFALASVVGSAGKLFWEKEKKRAGAKGNIINTLALLITLSVLPGQVLAQEVREAQQASSGTQGLPGDIYLLFILLFLELIIILTLSRILFHFLNTAKNNHTVKVKSRFKELFQKLNQTVALEEESSLDMAHDYDGIRELDNKVPTWWQYAFYATILFSIVYLYRMFISETLPDQLKELDQAKQVAAVELQAYLKSAANNVDENTVTLLDAAGIAEGAMLFSKNCVACHGDKGQGGVGPNLTDNYWLHKGDIKSVFHSIKYGIPEKGMKAWKDDFSPAQIAQLASYIKSIEGTHPAGAKEPQGDLYSADPEHADTKADSSTASL